MTTPKFQKKLWLALAIMAVLTPIGILLPKWLNAGDAWGEWGADAVESMIGYVPEGMKKTMGLWKAPAPDYGFGASVPFWAEIASYAASALIGGLACGILVYLLLRRREKPSQ